MSIASGRRRVCVIGAGISGLVSAKTLSADGFDVTVFEKASALGGVWAPSRTYPELRSNATRETYAFSDHPYPASADKFPLAGQIRSYLESYADRFGIRSKIVLGTEVVHVSRDATKGSWVVKTRQMEGAQSSIETQGFEFVVVCNGVFSEPNLPEISDRHKFGGKILHSSEALRPDDIRGKHVVVIGAGKSAADCATYAAKHARSSALVFRRPYWMLPRYAFGLINMELVACSRFVEFFMPYYRLNRSETFFHDSVPQLARLSDKIILNLFRFNLRIPRELDPGDMSLSRAAENAGFVSDFYKLVRTGRIKTNRDEIECILDQTRIRLKSGKDLAADIIICATGWKQKTSFFASSVLEEVQRDGSFRLYRAILPPKLQTLGFVGYNSSTSCQITSEIGAHWLSDVFLGRMRLPIIANMEDDIDRVEQWVERELPNHRGGFYIGPFVSHYIDDLLRDMGLPTRRTRSALEEFLLPRWPSRYSAVGHERRNRRAVPSFGAA